MENKETNPMKEEIFNNKSFKRDIKTKRIIWREITMDVACEEIGISKATLSRLEKGKNPDIETYAKVCKWLGTNISTYFE